MKVHNVKFCDKIKGSIFKVIYNCGHAKIGEVCDILPDSDSEPKVTCLKCLAKLKKGKNG